MTFFPNLIHHFFNIKKPMNILSIYISDKDKETFERFLMTCCQTRENAFYFDDFQFYFDRNNCILDELNSIEINKIKNNIGCFIAYAIVYKDLGCLFGFLKNEKFNLDFLLDNDRGCIIDNRSFIMMDFQDFIHWVEYLGKSGSLQKSFL